MASLSGQTIASSYEQLLHVDNDGGGNSTTLVNIKDGDNGTTFALQLSTDKVQSNGTLTVGADTDGHDVKFFGDTTGRYCLWDESDDRLIVNGVANEIAISASEGFIYSNDGIGIGDATSIDTAGGIHLKTSTALNPVLKIENTTNHASNDQNLGIIEFKSTTDQDSLADWNPIGNIEFRGNSKDGVHPETHVASIVGYNRDPGNARGAIKFFTRADTADDGFTYDYGFYDPGVGVQDQTRLEIASDGKIKIGGDGSPTHLLHIYNTADHTTGSSMYVYRGLASGSTNSPVAQIHNASGSDDQTVLYLSQRCDKPHIELAHYSASAGSGGIKFPATFSGNSDVNTLDDYEEGTWDMTVVGSTSGSYGLNADLTTQSYTKIGNLVHIQGQVQATSDSSASGYIRFSLPTSVGASADRTDGSGQSYGTAFLTDTGSTIAQKTVLYIAENVSYFTIYLVADDTTSTTLTDSSLDTSWALGFSATYFT